MSYELCVMNALEFGNSKKHYTPVCAPRFVAHEPEQVNTCHSNYA